MKLILERRPEPSRAALALAPIAAILFTLAVCALLVAWAGAPVGRTYALLFEGAFGSKFALSETLPQRGLGRDAGRAPARRRLSQHLGAARRLRGLGAARAPGLTACRGRAAPVRAMGARAVSALARRRHGRIMAPSARAFDGPGRQA